MYGWVLSIEIQTAGWIAMKFGTEVVLKYRKVLGWVLTWYPRPPGYGVHKGDAGCLWSLSRAFPQRWKFSNSLHCNRPLQTHVSNRHQL